MTRTIFSSSPISSVRFCRRPAVSTSTTSTPCVLAAVERVEGEARRIGARLARHHAGAGALAPDLELIDGGGAEGVAGHQHHRLALGAESGGELADGRGLAGAVDAGDQDDERLAPVDLQRLGDGREHLLDLGGEHRLHLVGRDALVEAAFAERRGDAGGELRRRDRRGSVRLPVPRASRRRACAWRPDRRSRCRATTRCA